MYHLTDAYPEMHLATAQDRIRRLELSHQREQWRAEQRQSRGGRRRVARWVGREAPSTPG